MLRHTITGLVIDYVEAITEHCQCSFLNLCDYTSAHIRCRDTNLLFSLYDSYVSGTYCRGESFAFSAMQKIKVSLGPYPASNSPPDCCERSFDSPSAAEIKCHPLGGILFWWSRGESNPCPKATWKELLRAQFVIYIPSSRREQTPYGNQ